MRSSKSKTLMTVFIRDHPGPDIKYSVLASRSEACGLVCGVKQTIRGLSVVVNRRCMTATDTHYVRRRF